MICAIHQPQYLPWIGYFDKMDAADVFVYYDNTQFKKNEWQNRNRIKGPSKWQWLTIPVTFQFGQTIRETIPVASVRWAKKHWQSIMSCYGKAPYFEDYAGELKELYDRDWPSLADVNIAFIEFVARRLEIDTKTFCASSISFEGAA